MPEFADFVGSTNGMVSRVEHFQFKNRQLFGHHAQLTGEAHDHCIVGVIRCSWEVAHRNDTTKLVP